MTRISVFSRLCFLAAFAVACAIAPRAAPAQSLYTQAADQQTPDKQTSDQQASIVGVIQNQLNAFRSGDGPGAYGYAAPNIQTVFPSADIFMQMVRGGYGFLIDPAGVEFLDIRVEGADIYQAVRVVGRDGKRRIAIYQMERQADGSWKIAGVYITEDPQAAV